MRRNQPEAAIQKEIVTELRQRGVPGLMFWHTPNSSKLGGKKTKSGIPLEAIRLKHLGFRPGVADLVLLHDGKFFALELKADHGQPTEAQLAFLQDVNNCGGYSCFAHGLKEAIWTLEAWGLLKGTLQ